MRPAWEYMPGVPAAGHIAGGYWHPGRIDGCTKCPAPAPPSRGPLGRNARVFWNGVFPNPKRTGTIVRTGQLRHEVLWDGETVPVLVPVGFLARVKP